LNAMVRNLGKMTSIGLIGPGTESARLVASRLADADYLKKSRVHPMSVLTALRVYESGRGVKGNLSWTAERRVIDALDNAFYLSFGNVEPTGKSTILALDVSGSMTNPILGSEVLSCREASVAMALITANVEQDYEIMGFSTKFTSLNVSPKMRLNDAINNASRLPFAGTDCSLPMEWALSNRVKTDVFVVYTDNETYAGSRHPHQALKDYRKTMNIPAKLVVVGMAVNDFTIADPNDAGMLDVVGFSNDTPSVISNFIK